MSSPTESNWKSDLPVQSLPTRSWSFVVWQILTSLQSFAQIPRPPPPHHHLQLLGTDAQCSCTRQDSAGCSRAGGPGGSSHSHTQPLSWRSLAEVDMARLLWWDVNSCSCFGTALSLKDMLHSQIEWISNLTNSHPVPASDSALCLSFSRWHAKTQLPPLSPPNHLRYWRRWKGNLQRDSHSSWHVCALPGFATAHKLP